MTKEYSGIWCRNAKPSKSDWRNRNLGKLVVDDYMIKFKSSKSNITINKIEEISIGLKGDDLINGWIEIKYINNEKVESIYFADWKLFAYSGILGGTARIAEHISKSFNIKLEKNTSYIKIQVSYFFILIFLLIYLFYL